MDWKNIFVLCYALLITAPVFPGFGRVLLQHLEFRDKQCFDGLWEIISEKGKVGLCS